MSEVYGYSLLEQTAAVAVEAAGVFSVGMREGGWRREGWQRLNSVVDD